MLQTHSRGAFARAAIVACCLFLVQASVLNAQAAGWRRAWQPERDSYRVEFDPFANWRPLVAEAPRAGPSEFAHGAVAALVAAKAEAFDVPARLALAVARFESGLRMSMRGAAGERGAMQVLPQTALQVGVVGNLYGEAGIEAGVRYLKLAMAMHRQAGWCAVASAYNRGVWRRSRCTAYGRAVTALAALR
jgi:soluble lytic murein transglycosylase-like protein